MMKAQNAKRTLISSFLAMLLCSVMFVGTTYAWFTKEVSNENNQIVTGDLEIGVYQVADADENIKETPVTADTDFFADAKWVPGAVYYENFYVKNEGSLSLKYELDLKWSAYNFIKVEEASTSGVSLTDVLQVAVVQGVIADNAAAKAVFTSTGEAAQTYADTLEKGETDQLTIIVYWPSGDSDNTYNVGSSTSLSDGSAALYADLGIVLEATQANKEADSFGTKYDESAAYPSEEGNGNEE